MCDGINDKTTIKYFMSKKLKVFFVLFKQNAELRGNGRQPLRERIGVRRRGGRHEESEAA